MKYSYLGQYILTVAMGTYLGVFQTEILVVLANVWWLVLLRPASGSLVWQCLCL